MNLTKNQLQIEALKTLGSIFNLRCKAEKDLCTKEQADFVNSYISDLEQELAIKEKKEEPQKATDEDLMKLQQFKSSALQSSMTLCKCIAPFQDLGSNASFDELISEMPEEYEQLTELRAGLSNMATQQLKATIQIAYDMAENFIPEINVNMIEVGFAKDSPPSANGKKSENIKIYEYNPNDKKNYITLGEIFYNAIHTTCKIGDIYNSVELNINNYQYIQALKEIDSTPKQKTGAYLEPASEEHKAIAEDIEYAYELSAKHNFIYHDKFSISVAMVTAPKQIEKIFEIRDANRAKAKKTVTECLSTSIKMLGFLNAEMKKVVQKEKEIAEQSNQPEKGNVTIISFDKYRNSFKPK